MTTNFKILLIVAALVAATDFTTSFASNVTPNANVGLVDLNPLTRIEKMIDNYEKVSKARPGTMVKCPVCGLEYEKERHDEGCCGRRCEETYQKLKKAYVGYKEGVVSLKQIKEAIEDYIKDLKKDDD